MTQEEMGNRSEDKLINVKKKGFANSKWEFY
jgi:hypothetical protein